jgi:hypothetical protein
MVFEINGHAIRECGHNVRDEGSMLESAAMVYDSEGHGVRE